jgi:hypothetical protein
MVFVKIVVHRISCGVSEFRGAGFVLWATSCFIPDDHIDPRRRAFFMAKSVLGDAWEEEHHARSIA